MQTHKTQTGFCCWESTGLTVPVMPSVSIKYSSQTKITYMNISGTIGTPKCTACYGQALKTTDEKF